MLNSLFFLGAANPYVSKINGLLTDAKGWLFGIIGGITVLVIVAQGVKYQQGGEDEKASAKKAIRGALIMGGGIFFLAWLGTYVVSKMQ